MVVLGGLVKARPWDSSFLSCMVQLPGTLHCHAMYVCSPHTLGNLRNQLRRLRIPPSCAERLLVGHRGHA
jgi:hypothetical protein